MNSIVRRGLLLAFCAAGAYAPAGPGAVEIDSLPVAAACTQPAGQTGLAGKAAGATLLRVAGAQPASAGGGVQSAASAGELYQATMDLADWGGHFSRYLLPAVAAIAATAGGGAGVASTLSWDAGAILTGTSAQAPMPAPDQRSIYTAIVQSNGALTMVPFSWSALSPAQQASLDLDDHAGEQRLDYLRGDRSLEGAPFRKRSSVLGDSVHSTPRVVGPADHPVAVYLGANDGMLHAFDAISGLELFAYVPDALIAQLHQLTNPAYVHRAYVDGPANAGAALIGGVSKTVLLSAMGGGAHGVFALDVTDPKHFSSGLGALWEFTDRDDTLMGNVTTLPQVARVRVSKSAYRYFAIVASGLNNASDGKGALFLLALDKPRTEGWKRNFNYYRIVMPATESALTAPVLLNDADGALRYAYSGDLQGNLWRFDFTGYAPWASEVSQPMFVARDAGGKRQPITQQPSLAYAQLRGYMVLFGTGRLIEKADRATVSTQSYYGIIDSLQTPPDIVTGRSQLAQRFLDGGGAVLSISGAPMDAGSKGWYVDFIPSSERSVSSSALVDGALVFNTVLPGADICSATTSRSYVLNALTGLADDGSFTAHLPNGDAIVGLMLPDYAPSLSSLPQLVTQTPRDPQGRIMQDKTYAVAQVDGQGNVTSRGAIKSARRVGRLSWREIANWRELHEAEK